MASPSIAALPPIAIVDVGSSSGRLIVVRLTGHGHLETVADGRTMLRLLRTVDAEGNIGPEGVARTVAAIQSFQQVALHVGADAFIAVATSAVRAAPNRSDFVKAVQTQTGVEMQVLTGESEAKLAARGAVHGLPVEDGLVIDIGGGSLEVARFRKRRTVEQWTLPLGALRLSDAFLHSDPPSKSEIAQLVASVHEQLNNAGVPQLDEGESLVGTGGTMRNIAKIDRGRYGTPIPRIHGHQLLKGRVAEVAERVTDRALDKRAGIRGLSSDRVDTIVGGVQALLATMDHVGGQELIVSGQGLREGVALEHYSLSSKPVEVRRASVLSLASRFSTWDEARADWRAAVAGTLFDLLEVDSSSQASELLGYAARLVDIGASIDYYNRWEQAAKIVRSADLNGFSHQLLADLCNLIAMSDSGRPLFQIEVSTPGQSDWVPKAAVVLSMADHFERRTHPEGDLKISRRDNGAAIVLTIPLAQDWDAKGVASRFRQYFGRELVLETGSRASGVAGLVGVELK